ncbi:hypothetical protein [Mycobacterium sp. NAZ190054]|uniref:hypothetical protein n=1 Tax=Mycobacterium sp. NAZ190054 TaxID=1747766 RepID=UPI0007940B90|nr:hypothetical protein [Mycobacterium sp. NAZ190054]KWX66817.1 hypothetical protein ASJ79_05485 [Mycobacterium sp. NAZ190054]
MSVEIRHVVVGDCDCGVPKYSWEPHNGHEHYWECAYGRIPSFDVDNPAPLILAGRDWVHDVLKEGGKRTIGDRFYTITAVPAPDEHGDITETAHLRMFQRLDYRGRSWTWELEAAHWADPPTRHNNAPIYLGRWPD